MRYFKILCILAFGILLASCHKISSGTTILVPTKTDRKYVITVKGKSGNKNIEEDFKVSKKDFERLKIGDNFNTD